LIPNEGAFVKYYTPNTAVGGFESKDNDTARSLDAHKHLSVGGAMGRRRAVGREETVGLAGRAESGVGSTGACLKFYHKSGTGHA
jgi:hypothetical protein